MDKEQVRNSSLLVDIDSMSRGLTKTTQKPESNW